MMRWVSALLVSMAVTAAEIEFQAPLNFIVERAIGSEGTRFPMFATFGDNGDLYVAESSGLDLYEELKKQTRRCQIRVLRDADRDGKFESAHVFADQLVFPMGLAWRNGKLFVADPPDLVTIEDTDRDGRADKRKVILTGFGHTDNGSLHGVTFGPDGWLYMTMGQPDGYRLKRADGSILEGKSGALIRCREDGSDPEALCRGFENLVEIVFLPSGEIIGTDNWFFLPQEGVRDALVHLVRGGVYPLNAHATFEKDLFFSGELLPPISVYSAVALSGLMRYNGRAFPVEFQGSLFSAQFNTRKIVRHQLSPRGASFQSRDEDFVSTENPDFHPSDVLEAPDGSILIIDTGSWYVQHCPTGRIRNAPATGGIYRVRYNGPPSKSEAPAPVARIDVADDPFARHAFVYDLFRTATSGDLQKFLRDPRAEYRRAALILLDQTPHRKLTPEEAVAALNDPMERVRSAAAFVFKKHPEWTPHVISFTTNLIAEAKLTGEQQSILGDLVSLTAKSPTVAVAIERAAGNATPQTAAFLVDLAAFHQLPGDWSPPIRAALESSHEPTIIRAIKNLTALKITSLHNELLAISRDPKFSPSLRLEALRARRSPIDEGDTTFLFSLLQPTNNPSLRLAAHDIAISLGLSNRFAQITGNDPLLSPQRNRATLEETQKQIADLEPLLKGGDPNRGQQLFLGQAACAACHRVGKQGGLVGPDLTRLGAIRAGRDILESLVAPNSTIAQGYDSYEIELTSGEALSGIRANRDESIFILRNAAGSETKINPSEIRNIKRSEVSLMPEGLLAPLQRTEISDLLAYLQSLR